MWFYVVSFFICAWCNILCAQTFISFDQEIKWALQGQIKKAFSIHINESLPQKSGWILKNIRLSADQKIFCAIFENKKSKSTQAVRGRVDLVKKGASLVEPETIYKKVTEEKAVFLKKGTPVLLMYEKNGMRIRAHGGQLLKRSQVGDMVHVRNPFRKRAKPLVGRLINTSTVLLP